MFFLFFSFFFLSLFLNGFDIWHELWEYKSIKRDLILGDVKRKSHTPVVFKRNKRSLAVLTECSIRLKHP